MEKTLSVAVSIGLVLMLSSMLIAETQRQEAGATQEEAPLAASDLAVLQWSPEFARRDGVRFWLNGKCCGTNDEGFLKIVGELAKYPTNSLLVLAEEAGDIPIGTQVHKDFLDVVDRHFLWKRIPQRFIGTNFNELAVFRWASLGGPLDEVNTDYFFNGLSCGRGTNGFAVVLEHIATSPLKTLIILVTTYGEEPLSGCGPDEVPFESRYDEFITLLDKKGVKRIRCFFDNVRLGSSTGDKPKAITSNSPSAPSPRAR